jgi:hypothetical protein
LGDIFIVKKALSRKFCAGLIDIFKSQKKKIKSSEYNQCWDEDARNGKVVILKKEVFSEELREEFFSVINNLLSIYANEHAGFKSILNEDITWTVPRIEEVPIEGGFNWHFDSRQRGSDRRFLTVVCYLNDVEEGGELEFLMHDIKVSAEVGTCVLFPPFWTHPHRGCPPITNVKYALGTFGYISTNDTDHRFQY